MQTNSAPKSVPAETCPEIELKVAASRHERQLAFELTYQAYLRAGLCEENECGMRATKYQLLPTTDVFIARLRGDVISTVSLVRDSEHGLPMEDIFPEVVAERRAAGKRIAEVSCLADRRSDPGRFFQTFCELGRLMAQLAIRQGIDEFLIVVHPRHSAIYRRSMAFRRVGECRDYSTVCGNPGVPLVLNFADAKVNSNETWRKFFGEQLSDGVLEPAPLSAADREYYLSVMAPAVQSVHFAPGTLETGAPTSSAGGELLCA